MTTYAGFLSWMLTTAPGLIFLMVMLLAIWVLKRAGGMPHRAAGILMIIGGLVLYAVAVH